MSNARYAELFLSESREHLSVVNDALLQLERGAAPADAVRELFRAVHSVKGMSAAMGFTAVTELAHELETVLDLMRAGSLPVTDDAVNALFAAADVLEQSVAAAIDGADGRGDATGAIERLRALVAALPAHVAVPPYCSSSYTPAAPLAAAPATATVAWHVTVRQAPDTPLPGVRAMLVVRQLGQLAAVLQTVPPLAELQELRRPAEFEVRLAGAAGVDEPRIAAAARAAGDVDDVRVAAAGAPRPDGRAGAIPAASLAAPPERSPGAGPVDRAASRSVRVDVRHLDTLLDLAGELLIARGRLQDAVGATPAVAVRDSVNHLARLVGALQEEVLAARLVPVWQVFDRFPRLVRDAARTLGKEVELVVEGKEIELDRSLLDEIGDPVMHLLRNAVDHGIETPAERTAAGKAPAGRLTLSAVRDRDAVLIRVQDDGRGVDRERVRRRGLALGLLADADEPSEEELIQLISRAGFSTAERVTDLSGRGVGVDAVQARLRALGGSVDFRSRAGQGTAVTLRLPLTLAIVRTLLARVDDEIYALPASHVSTTAELAALRTASVRGERVLMLGNEMMPMVDLRELVGLAAGAEDDREVVVVEARDRRLGLVVDELLGQQDSVVKRFDAARGALPCFSGATVLGNGMPALIVDVGRLFT